MSSLKVGRKVGPWTLRRFLGGGGNADVWEAERDGEVASACSRSGEPSSPMRVMKKHRFSSDPESFAIRRD